MSRPKRERRSVVAVEAIGPYALVRVTRARPEPFGRTSKTSDGGAQSPAYTAPLPSGSDCR